MIFPGNFEEKVGFTALRDMLMLECRNGIARQYVTEICFEDRHLSVATMLGQVEEYLSMMREVYGHPDPVVEDFTFLLETIMIPGSWFEPEYLPGFHDALSGILDYTDYFNRNDKLPYLRDLTAGVVVDREVVGKTGSLLDEKGEIRDSASPELARIRKEIVTARARSERMLRKILKEGIATGVLPRDTEVTLKNGRYVIPVPAARKRQIRGYVHDTSGSGQTFYIEPAEVMELFNEVRELELAERREIIRILIDLADRIRPHLPALHEAFRYAGMLDFIRAKARLALKIGGSKPRLEDQPIIDWKKAVHPLLFLSLREQQREVVPLDIQLADPDRILIISGPNAGGKSVCLKTAGLLQYMLQCGLLIPVHPNSTSGIFSSLFIDIGDEQSIENDLSTYSSHLLSMKYMLEHADGGTLFLIDELGSGTEPGTGGAIAEAALEMVAGTGAYGVVTTHYANLKLMAGKVPGIYNGAMLFDTKEMKPLYRLRTGRPGSSFAFEIAAKTGMPDSLLNLAREKTGREQYEFDYQIQHLESEKEQLESRRQELEVADAFLAEMIGKYTKLYQKLEGSKKEILQDATREAKRILEQSNSLIERTVKEIRESGAIREEVKKIRTVFRKEAERLILQPPANPDPGRSKPEAIKVVDENRAAEEKKRLAEKLSPEQLKPGDCVSMKGFTRSGEVVKVTGQKVKVVFGDVTMTVRSDQLVYASPESRIAKPVSSGFHAVLKDLDDKRTHFRSDIDVRGLRAEEAVRKVRELVNDAVLLNVKSLRILHGKGDGILRQVIRDLLAGTTEVKSFQDEHVDRGGHGITLVTLH